MAKASTPEQIQFPLPSSSYSDPGWLDLSSSSSSDDDSGEEDSGFPKVRVRSQADSPRVSLPRTAPIPINAKHRTGLAQGAGPAATVSTPPVYAINSPQEAAQKMLAEERRMALLNNQALIAASKENAVKTVVSLIDANVDVNRPDAEGYTALHHAAECGHFHLTMTLTARKADRNAATKDGYTAIMLAAKHGHAEVVEVLASYDIPDAQQADGGRSSAVFTPEPDHTHFHSAALALADKSQADREAVLQHAVTHNDVPMAARMLATGTIRLEEPDEHGHTLLGLAADRGDVEMIRLLLCTGAGVDATDKNGKTPLMHAAAKRQMQAITALLNVGALATATDGENESALSRAVFNDDTDVLRALLNGKSGALDVHPNIPLIAVAARLGRKQAARLLLDSRADRPDASGSRPLAVMAKQGELDALKTLLVAGADPHHKAWDGHTAFTLAAANGQLRIVQALIAYCPTPERASAWTRRLQNETDNKGRTALMLAVLNRKHKMTALLLEHEADPHKTDQRGRNAILWAAAKGDAAMVTLLIGYRATHVAIDRQGNNMLITAAERGNHDVVYLLCMPLYKNSVFNIDTPNCHGDTPVIVAARNGHLEVVRLLLQHGASVLHHNHAGRSALLESAEGGHREVLALLKLKESTLPMVYPVMNQVIGGIVRAVPAAAMIMPQPRSPQTRPLDGAGNSVLHLLASNGHHPLLETLLNASATPVGGYESSGAATSDDEGLWQARSPAITHVIRQTGIDIDVPNREGMTPLCLAARNGHYSTVEMLLLQGAQVNHVSRNDITPLWLACRLKECKPGNGGLRPGSVQMTPEMMVDLMLRHGALADQPSFQGQTPLLAASATGEPGIVRQLIDAGAKVDHADLNGLTPLMHASHIGHLRIATMLLDAGAVPDSRPGELSALVFAAEGGHDAVARLLVERGAEANHVDAYGSTALIVASAAGKLSTVKLLLELGADPMTKDRHGRNAMYYADKRRHSAVSQALQEGCPEPRDF